tara:strand:+ start:1722 stop:1967 length:246 start_codon:yes stop_codon:yes gene_type:complete
MALGIEPAQPSGHFILNCRDLNFRMAYFFPTKLFFGRRYRKQFGLEYYSIGIIVAISLIVYKTVQQMFRIMMHFTRITTTH